MTTMRPLKSLITIGEAFGILWEDVAAVERTVTVSILEAGGRVLAEDVIADRDVPPFARAAMDGYAVVAEDTFGAGTYNPKVLRLSEVLHAGDVTTRRLHRGQCFQIGTGAPIPDGSDAVVIVEDTEPDGNNIKVYKPVYPGANITVQGADILKGQTILSRGAHLNPSRIGVLASLGRDRVPVFDRPRIAVIPSGDEICPLGRELKPGEIYDINSYTLAALIREHGGEPVIYPAVPDHPQAVKDTLTQAAADCDLIVLSGGSSAGERDFMVDAITEMGQVKFHGIAVKPGKPTLGGVLKDRVVIGMPGYPTSCLTNAYFILIPLTRKMARLPAWQPQRKKGIINRRVTSTVGRHQFLTVRLADGEIDPAFKESGTITSMSQADGYVEIPENVDLVEKGEELEVILF